MPRILSADSLIYMMLVGHQVGIAVHVAFYNRGDAVEAVIINCLSTDNTVSFNHDKDWLLIGSLAPFVGNSLLLAGLAAKILFVYLDDTADSGKCFMAHVHHLSDGLTKFPSSFLGDTDQPGQYHRRDALTGSKHVVNGQYPGPQRQLGAVHRRLGCNRKVPMATGTFI